MHGPEARRHKGCWSWFFPTRRTKNPSSVHDRRSTAIQPVEALLQLGRDEEFPGSGIVLNPQHIRLAADLTVFHVALLTSRGLVHSRDVPLPATRTLETCFHDEIISDATPCLPEEVHGSAFHGQDRQDGAKFISYS